MSDLKPCPACGGVARDHRWKEFVHVRCEDRECVRTRSSTDPVTACELWNSLPRRADFEAEVRELAQMGAILPQLRDEDRERRRFEAAVALLATMATRDLSAASAAEMALHYADALLAALAKERP
jgi:hypothetical protein